MVYRRLALIAALGCFWIADTARGDSISLHAGCGCPLCCAAHADVAADAGPVAGAVPKDYHIGIHFLTERITPDPGFAFDLEPFLLTDPDNNFVRDGGLAGISEEMIQRKVVLAVEDAFRDINTGDPDRTVRIAIHEGEVPTHLEGRRLNVAMGQSVEPSYVLLGQAKQGSFATTFPQDDHAAVAFTDEIDSLGNGFLTFASLSDVVNSIAGTTAHEIGHVFGLNHVQVQNGDPLPWPLMGTESTNMPTSARLTERRFSTIHPAGTANAQRIINAAGTVDRADFNMDDSVDASDAATLFANWGLDDRLFHEGDADNNHLLDAADAGMLFGQWTGDARPSVATVSATLNPATGEVVVTSAGAVNWYLQSEGGGLTGAEPAGIGESGYLTNNDWRVGETSWQPLNYEVALGAIGVVGIDDLRLFFNAGLGANLQSGTIVLIPEPGCLLWILAAGAVSRRMRRRSGPRGRVATAATGTILPPQ